MQALLLNGQFDFQHTTAPVLHDYGQKLHQSMSVHNSDRDRKLPHETIVKAGALDSPWDITVHFYSILLEVLTAVIEI